MVTVLGGLGAIIFISIRVERIFLRREQDRLTPPEPKQKPWTEPGPNRAQPVSPLTSSELLYLAALANKYRDNPQAGWKLAGWLRLKLPGVPDVEIMRCTRALAHVAHTFARNEPDAATALDKFVYQCGGAALDLTSLERQDIEK